LSPPSIAELRAETQPAWLLSRPGAEHWAGRLYMRRISPYATRVLIATRLHPNVVTALMIPTGLLAALLLTFPGVLTAVGAVLLAQLQLLLDCADGEVARWQRRQSPAGVYLDQVAHYTTEAALPAALGVRAAGGWDSLDGWTSLGLLVAVLILLLKSETHLVGFALARVPRNAEAPASATPAQATRSFRLRDGVRILPDVRPFQAVEATFLALLAAIGDAVTGDPTGSRVLLIVLACAAAVAVVGHLAAQLGSDRLR
jgi:phosphatidylglycerophosphate synthase